jgi:hypothetical protein
MVYIQESCQKPISKNLFSLITNTKAMKRFIQTVFTLLVLTLSFATANAHVVNYYTGTCNSGPTYSVQPNVSYVNNNSNYAWQYKNGSNWVCIVNGNNTINGNTYNVTGATYTGTQNPGPIVFTNPNNSLQGLEIRCLISDGANPCNMPSGNTWTSNTNHFINITGTSCSCNNVTSAGSIGYDETLCGTSADPSLIQSLSLPSGGSGTLEYVWLASTDGGNSYTTIANSNSATYDPGVITQTTWYRRCARRSGCGTYSGESNWVMKELTSCCQNVTSGGTIGYDETVCANSFDPALIQNVTLPTGGSGTLEYLWLVSTDGGNTYTAIPNSNTATYDPGVITQTTWYRRCARRAGCASYVGESNWIKKELIFCAPTLTCPGTSYSWTQTIDPATGNPSIVKLISGSTNTYTISSGFPAAMTSGPVNLTISQVVSYDGYASRNTVTQTNERWRVIFKKNGSTIYSSPYTNDLADMVKQASWTGSLGNTFYAPNGIDQIIFEHFDVANGYVGPGSVIPSGICINYQSCPTAIAGNPVTLTCTTPSAVLGSAAVAGNTYSWTPTTGLSASNQAQPTASPISTTTYTVTVTSASGCTSTSSVVVTVDKNLPTANAGVDKNLNCTTTSTTIGTAAIAGNSYSWSPSTGLSAINAAMPTANPSSTTTYTVIVTGSNGCTATDVVIVNVNTTPPTANAGVDKNLNCITTSTTIGTTAIAGNSYSWSPATGLSATNTAMPTANPSSTTTYTVTVTGSNGCTATDVVIVNVNTTPPTADAGVDKNLNCTTTSTTIGTSAIAGNSYSWSPATGLSATNVAMPTANPSATTTYTVTVTGSNGCTATDVVVVNVNTTLPTANAGSNKNLNCTTTSSTIGTTAIAGNSYSWSPATGLSATNVAMPTASPSATTVYTVTVTGSNGCTATSTVTVNVNTTPPTADAGVDKNLNCTTTSTTIGTTAIAGNSYSWSPATGLSATNVAMPTANPSSTTTYTVTVTGTNGCTATDAVVVNVNTISPFADAGNDKSLNCTTTSATIGTSGIVGNSYSWSPATGLNVTTVPQPTASPSSTTSYTVTVTNASNGCTATDVVIVNVNTTPPTADAGVDKNLNCTTTSTTIGTTAIAGNSYSWSPATGLSATNVAMPTANPSATTTYTVTVTGSNGCTATDVVVVNVNTTLPTANAGSNKNLNCTTTSSTIGTTAIAGNSYSWSPATGLSATNVAMPTASPSATTVYTVTVTGSNGCTATSTVTVNVNTTPPTADAGVDKNLNCTTTSTTIGTTAIAGNSYSWSPATGLSATNVAQPTANPSANYNIYCNCNRFKWLYRNGCSNSICKHYTSNSRCWHG